MSTVEPIRDMDDLRCVEAILARKPRDLLFFTIGTNCGLRISDILNLNVRDVKNKNYIQLHEQKTGKFKKFPVNSKLKMMFDKYTKNRKLNEPLFKTRFNNRLSRITAYCIIKKACEQAKLEIKTGTHTMRKTFGYHYYQKYKDVALLQKIFNHSTPQVTLRYIGINQEMIDNSIRNFIL